MDFKLISKNNIGSAVLLLLAIALSQSKAFNFLVETALGRLFLIIFILCLSYCHKILGVVGILFIIIMFNSNVYYEGFESKSKSKSNSNSNSNSTDDSSSTDASNNSTDVSNNSTDPSNNSTVSLNTDQIKEMIKQQISSANSGNSGNSETTEDGTKKNSNSTASEGFDILGIENNIKRGKQSNSIPVNSFTRNVDFVSPYDGTSFLGSFSLF